jgi:serine/threonine-protein kinase
MKFGQYELLEQIAVGGMAEVFKGRVVAAEGFEKHVAIKRILPDLAEDERFVKMLLTEARIHSALSHRNIVQIHDLGISEQGEYFIVLEYVEGYDLRIITEQIHGAGEIIPEALSLHIAAEIAQGLHFAHELRGSDGQPLGLIHRDVTPSNILISFAGEVKLSDFGLAKRRSDRSVVGSLKGNLAYMSPEQAMQAELDRRTDIFSLGAVLFELITGRRLREITDEVAGWSQVASGVVQSARKLRPDLPLHVEQLLDSALAADPAKRFPDAAAFGTAIRGALAQLNIAVGASDLSALLGVITPPRQARTLNLERSKVIRLGPEALALKEALAAPATPAPVLVTPGVTPPPRGTSVAPRAAATPRAAVTAAPPRFADPGATPSVTPPPPVNDGIATPMPNTPPPPAHTRGRTPMAPARARAQTPRPPAADPDQTPGMTTTPPARARGKTPHLPGAGADWGPTQNTPPLPGARPRGKTPLAPAHVRGQTPVPPRSRVLTQPPPTILHPGAPRPTPPRSQPVPQGTGRSPQSRPHNLPPSQRDQQQPQQPQPRASTWPPSANQPAGANAQPGQQAAGRARTSGQQPAVPPETPAYGVQRPPPAAFAGGRQSQPQFPAQPAPALSFNPARVHHATARIQLRTPARWPKWVLTLVVLLGGAAGAVHLFFVPLDVLITWRSPARLSITTQPTGATLKLDGVPQPGAAPTTISVWRDRAPHIVEASLPGFETTRDTVRYDRSVALSVEMYLPKDKAPPPPPAPPPSAPPDNSP